MRWRQPAYRPLAEAIVDCFSQKTEESQTKLACFTPAQWRMTWFWLDASGLALYLLSHAEHAGFVSALDPATVVQLRCKLEDNCERSAGLFREFIDLNQAFDRAGIVFVNLKGFTLTPYSCADPRLRLQLDLDFLVRSSDLAACKYLVEQRGYELSAATSSTLEFKAEHHAEADFCSPYSKTPHRSVELHLHLSGLDCDRAITDQLLNRRVYMACGTDAVVPVLSPADQLISQALHILGHLRGATTRPSWLLEFGNHVHARTGDPCFWFDVQHLSRRNPLMPVAVGTSMLLARDLFGLTIPAAIQPWAEHSVPEGIRVWLQHYGRRAVLADFPGTKLYLLLERELSLGHVIHATARSPSVLPTPRIPKLFRSQREETTRTRFRGWWMQSLYILFRLRFHISQGLVYMLESHRWRKLSASTLQS